MSEKITIESVVVCNVCKAQYKICYFNTDYDRWKAGQKIQDAMPYLTADQSLLLLSKICCICYDSVLDHECELNCDCADCMVDVLEDSLAF